MKTNSPILSYIKNQPIEVQDRLMQIRQLVLEQVPNAIECISYSMPAFKLDKLILCFAAFKNHIGIYPTGAGVVEFEKWTNRYQTSKGAIQLPINEALPVDLLIQLIQTRVKQIQHKEKIKHSITCPKGHVFEKSTNCKSCPVCAKNEQHEFFLKQLPAPAIRALKSHQIVTLTDFTRYTESSVASFHGLGPKSMSVILNALKKAKLTFKTPLT